MKTKENTLVKGHSLQSFCVGTDEKRGMKLTYTENLPNFGWGTLATTVLTLIKSDDA